MNNIIEVNGVSYKRASKLILDNVSFSVSEGESFALIGENGSGKTTILELILNDIKPTQGSTSLLGRIDRKKNFDTVGVVYGQLPLFPMLKVEETIRYFSTLYRVSFDHITKLDYISLFHLDKWRNSFVKDLSQGERQRLGILLSLMRDPEILIMDEPFSNLDPIIINKIWKLIKSPKRTLLFTTHNWTDVGDLADKICFIHEGTILNKPESPQAILDSLPSKRKVVVPSDLEKYLEGLQIQCFTENDHLHLFFDQDSNLIQLIEGMTKQYSVQEVSLKDAYLYRLINYL